MGNSGNNFQHLRTTPDGHDLGAVMHHDERSDLLRVDEVRLINRYTGIIRSINEYAPRIEQALTCARIATESFAEAERVLEPLQLLSEQALQFYANRGSNEPGAPMHVSRALDDMGTRLQQDADLVWHEVCRALDQQERGIVRREFAAPVQLAEQQAGHAPQHGLNAEAPGNGRNEGRG